tara:strand:- start:81 stop:347 length:267 start_codon:yes stop_codon:yes gene_type:complete
MQADPLLADIRRFMDAYPKLIKRALICGNQIVAWTAPDQQSIAKKWRTLCNSSLRMMPLLPLEGGWTQEHFNGVWDRSTPLDRNIKAV